MGPETCKCKSGYIRGINTIACVPHCAGGCRNGTCTAPNSCTCLPGYTKIPGATGADRNKCVVLTSCNPQCVNGHCTGNNMCTCNQGYVKDVTDYTNRRCIPACQPPCVNAQCSGPNLCICNAGFIKNTQIPTGNVCYRRYRRETSANKKKHFAHFFK